MSTTTSLADKKRGLQTLLKELRGRSGPDNLSDRELARRTGLHSEEMRRWLYGDHLPSARSVYEFAHLLSVIGANDGELVDILRYVDLHKNWNPERAVWYASANAAFGPEDTVMFVLKSADTGQCWHIAERTSPLHYRVVVEGGVQKCWDPALSGDGRLLIAVEQHPSGEHALELWTRSGRKYVLDRRLPLRFANKGAWSPDRSAICCEAGLNPARAPRAIFHYNLGSHETRQLTSGPFVDRWPAWSADGTYIAFQRDDELWAVDPETNRTWCLVDRSRTGGAQVWAPAFSPDGQRLAYVHGVDAFTSELRCLHLASLTVTTLASKPGMQFLDPCWSPDGQRVLVSSNAGPTGRFDLWLADADGGNLRQVSDYLATVFRPTWKR